MKTKHLINLFSLLFILTNLSAQTTPTLLKLEMSAGLAFNHQNLAGTVGLDLSIGAHMNTGLFMATDPMGYQEINSISSQSIANFSSAHINHRPAYGFTVKYYRHKNQKGIFWGSGIYQGAYKIDAFSFTEKDIPINSNIGGNIFGSTPDSYKKYHQTTTENKYFGITTELGYMLPVNNGRLEASFRVFNPLYRGNKFELYQENQDQKISVRENFRTLSGNFQLRYVRVF